MFARLPWRLKHGAEIFPPLIFVQIKFTYSKQNSKALSAYCFDALHKSLKEMHVFWLKYAKVIEKELKIITGLSFQKKKIVCRLNFKRSLSNPLSLKVENIDDMKDNLIHELIHTLFTQNYKGKFKKIWDDFWQSHKDNSLVKSHIAVHAVHYKFSQKLFPNRTKNIIDYSTDLNYKKSWAIVLQDLNAVLNEIKPKKQFR